MKLIIFGPPGSGKGTQGARIAEKLKIKRISTGDIFRDHIKRQTELGKMADKLIIEGKLVPDDITNSMVKESVAGLDSYILDGYPRNMIQARFLEEEIAPTEKVIHLDAPEDLIIKRLVNRRVCSKCKANFNLLFMPPKSEGVCDKCGGKLIQRDDDNEDSVKKRLEVYKRQSEPVIEFYREKGVVQTFDASDPPDKVFERIMASLDV